MKGGKDERPQDGEPASITQLLDRGRESFVWLLNMN